MVAGRSALRVQAPLLHRIISNGLPHARHQYVLTDACEPNAFMISVSSPSQNGHDGADGSVSGAHKPTGTVPSFYESLQSLGLEADRKIFKG